jgi:HPt (histidine-containing phosphotransfer) domain-containing protein
MSRTLTSLPPSLLEVGEEPNQQTLLLVAQLWERFKEATFHRIGVLEQAVTALGEGTLSEELRRQAEGEAHKLTGSVGMFGFAEGSRLASTIEQLLEAGAPLGPAETLHLSELVVLLRREVEQPSTVQAEYESLPDTDTEHLPAVGDRE